MINVQKSQPAPACLASEKLKASGSYRCGDVLPRLKADFNNKCYICGAKNIVNINAEHFEPHEGNIDLKFDWNNLFFACGHCNNTKLNKYFPILNCTNSEHPILDWIKFEMKPFPGEQVIIQAIENQPIVNNTVALLQDVFTGTTFHKKMEADNLRQHLLEEIKQFQDKLIAYFDDDNTAAEKAKLKTIILRQIRPSTPFTAFKIWILKSNKTLQSTFLAENNA